MGESGGLNWEFVFFAGGESPAALLERTGAKYRALITLQRKPVILPALQAVLSLSPRPEIEIYGPVEPLREALAAHLSAGDLEYIGFRPTHPGGLAGGVRDAVERREDERRLVLAAADLPLLRPPGVISFLKAAEACRDVAYPVIPREAIDRALVRNRTYLRTKDGVFTGGNLFAGRVGAYRQALSFLDPLIERRKSPWGLARIFGVRFLLGLLLGRWRLTEIADRMEEIAGVRLEPVVTTAFGLGVDLDKLGDFLLFRKLLDEP